MVVSPIVFDALRLCLILVLCSCGVSTPEQGQAFSRASHSALSCGWAASRLLLSRPRRVVGLVTPNKVLLPGRAGLNLLRAHFDESGEHAHVGVDAHTEHASSGVYRHKKPRKKFAPKLLPPAGASSSWEGQGGRSAGTSSPMGVVVVGPVRQHSATVIWLHGHAGDTAKGWASTAQTLQVPWCKFLFPIAPGGWFTEGSVEELENAAGVVIDLVCD